MVAPDTAVCADLWCGGLYRFWTLVLQKRGIRRESEGMAGWSASVSKALGINGMDVLSEGYGRRGRASATYTKFEVVVSVVLMYQQDMGPLRASGQNLDRIERAVRGQAGIGMAVRSEEWKESS